MTLKVRRKGEHTVTLPSGYSEKLFTKLKKSTEKFEIRLMMMNFISRLVGHHKLILFPLYPFIQKYMQPKQEHIQNLTT
jgi:protein SDA1